tara:strand:- start:2256 stop:2879 length:624 start_codon:yes stop_codon:yes gene_type:complete
MTAKEEDILTNQAYIQKGNVLDKLIESLIIDKDVNYKDLILGDKNSVLIAARVLGYGQNYKFEYKGEEHIVDLSEVKNKEIDESLFTQGENSFSFKLPHSGNDITYKILNGHDESKIEAELRGIKKIDKNASPELSTRLKYLIISVNGDSERKAVREFVDNFLLARDSRSLREHIKTTQPDVDLSFDLDGEGEVTIPIGINFFWPDA